MISESLAIKIFNLLHQGDSEEAFAYGLELDEIENNIINSFLLASEQDVYDLIKTISKNKSALLWNSIAIITQGWAAPLDESDQDVPPSLSENRKRVLIVCIVNSDCEIASVLQLENETPIFDTTGSGQLSHALKSIYNKKDIIKHETNKSYFI